jgi:peptidoglycan/xylan/chitin deacetylase (PgdA/CDA1 family)
MQNTVMLSRTGRLHSFYRLIALMKEALFFIYLYSGYVQLRDFLLAMLGRSRAVVIYYHRIGGCDVLTKPTDEFRRDLEYLKSHYECISLSELCKRLRANAPMRRRSVVITFDDGYRDNFTEAVPVLKQAEVTATFFVATGLIGTNREFPHDSRFGACSPKLTWDDLRAIEADGFEIGSHTVNHTNLGRADWETIEFEVKLSLTMLNCQLGEKPRAFSFPWGKPDDISEQAINSIMQAGYYAALSAYGGANTRGSNPFKLRRVDVGNGHMSHLAMRARVAGLDMDHLKLRLRKWRI